MTNHLCRGVAAAVFACLSVATAVASDREPVRVHVSRAGLDLADPRDQAIMQKRIRIAANEACVSAAIGFVRQRDERQCRAEMMRDGVTQVAAIGGPRAIEVASRP